MPPFRSEDTGRIDFRLMQNSPVVLYHSPAILREHVAELESLGYWCPVLDSRRWDTEEPMHDDFARTLDFPGYYGRNLNAHNDCLGDLPFEGRAGIGLVLTGYDTFMKQLPGPAWPVLDIIARQSRYALLTGDRLFAMVQTDDPRLQIEPVGGLAGWWNFREWSDRDRGL
jgi:hypothetical protein